MYTSEKRYKTAGLVDGSLKLDPRLGSINFFKAGKIALFHKLGGTTIPLKGRVPINWGAPATSKSGSQTAVSAPATVEYPIPRLLLAAVAVLVADALAV